MLFYMILRLIGKTDDRQNSLTFFSTRGESPWLLYHDWKIKWKEDVL